MKNDLRQFIERTAQEWRKTEDALRKLGYGQAIDHDTALLKSMGKVNSSSTTTKP